MKIENSRKEVCHLEWFVNSRCDYSCRGCAPKSSEDADTDLPLEICMKALDSFAEFAAKRNSPAQIDFYPRQATPSARFVSVLSAAGDLKRQGHLNKIVCVNRGDLPPDKIALYQLAGVDECWLSLDGPEWLQNELRRDDSFRDTLAAFRGVRAAGMTAIPSLILVQRNALHLKETMKILLDEGFDQFRLKVRVSGDIGGPNAGADNFADPGNAWNKNLTASGYRATLLLALDFLESVRGSHPDVYTRFVANTPMYARLFYELGRMDEYHELARHADDRTWITFTLRADGAVGVMDHLNNLPSAGDISSSSFTELYEKAHPLRWFDREADQKQYCAGKLREFVACRACPTASYCSPVLTGMSGRRLFYYPDTRCWVGDVA